MTTERDELTKFVRTTKKNVEAASALYRHYPSIRKEVILEFLETLWNAMYGDIVGIDGDLDKDFNYVERPRGECYLKIDKKSWVNRASIRLQNDNGNPNVWFIGICRAHWEKDGKVRYQELQSDLNRHLKLPRAVRPYDHWPWWMWLDDKYRNWESILPALNEETKKRGDVTDYLVGKLVAVARVATPIIDEIEA